MKKNILHTLGFGLIVVHACLLAETASFQQYKEYTDKNGHIFKKDYFQENPVKKNIYYMYKEELYLDGLIYTKTFTPSASVIEEGSYITANIRHGDWKTYNQQGQLEKTTSYENGLEVIPRREITTTYDYNKDNIPILKVIDRFPNNEIQNIHFYTKNTLTPVGNWNYYISENNQQFLAKTEQYGTQGIEQRILYHKTPATNIVKQISTYVDGRPDGPVYTYSENGTTLNVQYYKRGLDCYPNGQIMQETIPTSNNLSLSIRYYENGNIQTQATTGYLGLHGLFQQYNQEQILVTERYFHKNRNMIEVLTVPETGEYQIGAILDTGVNNIRDGLWITGNATEKNISVFYYTKGKPETTPNLALSEKNISSENSTEVTVTMKTGRKLLTAYFKNGLAHGWWTYYSLADKKNLITKKYYLTTIAS